MTDRNVPRQLGAILDVLGLTHEQLFEAEPEGGQRREKVVHWLYRVLDILDSKTSHLLRFASLLLAAQAFLAALLVRDRHVSPWMSVPVLILLAVPLIAAWFGLRVFRVEWLFFGKVRPADGVAGSAATIEEELRDLARVCDERAERHRRAFCWCVLAVVAFGLTLLSAVLIQFPIWADSSKTAVSFQESGVIAIFQ